MNSSSRIRYSAVSKRKRERQNYRMATAFSQKRSNRPAVKHLNHCHALRPFDAKEEDEIICSGCELDLKNSSAFKCTKSECDFFLHKECFRLPRELQHKFHPDHPLKLLFSLPYSEGMFTCNACGDYGTNIGCAFAESEECQEEEADASGYSVAAVQNQLRILQLQKAMSYQQAQMVTAMGNSLAYLA
ncbi:hypothetical protein Dsin_011068 [Dipteronia sinensis]|uniref:DC1 domain-containing protein n=1 Tax=Dipteronia sinensis TaxID=43782 RepID=A0AAE0AUF6_9ROSI|nr:hypothetical protein Dsin_011068 [Dipteronia sinensis]